MSMFLVLAKNKCSPPTRGLHVGPSAAGTHTVITDVALRELHRSFASPARPRGGTLAPAADHGRGNSATGYGKLRYLGHSLSGNRGCIVGSDPIPSTLSDGHWHAIDGG
jgi:hypothetical protein